MERNKKATLANAGSRFLISEAPGIAGPTANDFI